LIIGYYLMKLIFFASSQFAVPILEALNESDFAPAFVITEPDALAGRHQKPKATPIKEACEKLAIPFITPEKLKHEEFIKWLKEQNADLAIVCAYGKILPKEILAIPKFKFINVHPSLLPKYRGPSPIQTVILDGETETGVTILVVDELVDHGGIIAKSEIRISKSETYKSLTDILSKLGAELLIETIPNFISGKWKPEEQDHNQATFTKLIKKEDGHIDWSKSAQEIERMSRAYDPWPGVFAYWQKKLRIKFLKVSVLNPQVKCAENEIGKTFLTAENKLAVNCGTGIIEIEQLQLEGAKPMSAQTFLNGHKDFINSKLE